MTLQVVSHLIWAKGDPTTACTMSFYEVLVLGEEAADDTAKCFAQVPRRCSCADCWGAWASCVEGSQIMPARMCWLRWGCSRSRDEISRRASCYGAELWRILVGFQNAVQIRQHSGSFISILPVPSMMLLEDSLG